jgi:hypothetical protein
MRLKDELQEEINKTKNEFSKHKDILEHGAERIVKGLTSYDKAPVSSKSILERKCTEKG